MKTLLLTLLLLSTQLLANVATVTALKGKAGIQRASDMIPASLGSTLEEKDNILTQDNTKLQLIFKDETIVSIGKNSNFSISEYLFEDGQEPVAKFGMIKGAMRTITGKIAKVAPKKFTVETKTATIGIRGTNFTVIVREDGSYQAYCTYGTISVTINGEKHIVQQGEFITISPNGKILVSAFTPKDLKKIQDTYFAANTQKNTGLTKSSRVDENNEQLNVTINDDTEVIIAELENNTQDVIQNGTADVTTYVMNDALYTGTYDVTSSGGGGTILGTNGDSGVATLDIDFGADLANLKLTADDSSVHTFSLNPTFTSTGFSVEQTVVNTGNLGDASGTFSDSIGNTVNGNFKHTDGSTQSSSGTYTVNSTQVLH